MKFYLHVKGSRLLKIGVPPKVKSLLIRGLIVECFEFTGGQIMMQRHVAETPFHFSRYILSQPIKAKLFTHHSGFALFCMIKGSYYDVHQNYKVKENECQFCYFPKGAPLIFESEGDMDIFVFQFSLNEVDKLKQYHPDVEKFIDAYQNQSPHLLLSKPYSIETPIRLLMKEILNSDIRDPTEREYMFKQYAGRAYLKVIRAMIQMKLIREEEDEKKALFMIVKAYIIDNLDKDLSIPALCSHFHVNKNLLYELFHKYQQKSVGDFIQELRMIEAKRLLSETSLWVKEIMTYVGYAHESTFCAAFKLKFQLTPREFRMEERRKNKM